MDSEDSLLPRTKCCTPPRSKKRKRGPDPKDTELDRRLVQRLLSPEDHKQPLNAFCRLDEEFFGSQKKGASTKAFKRREQVRARNRKLEELCRKSPSSFVKHCSNLGVFEHINDEQRERVQEILCLPNDLVLSPPLLEKTRPSNDEPSLFIPQQQVAVIIEDMSDPFDKFEIPRGIKPWGKPQVMTLDLEEINNNPCGIIPRYTPQEKVETTDTLTDCIEIRVTAHDFKDVLDNTSTMYQARLQADKKSMYFFVPCQPDHMLNPKIQESYYSATDGPQGKASNLKQVNAMAKKKRETQEVDCKLVELVFPRGMKASTKYFNYGEDNLRLKRQMKTIAPDYKYKDKGTEHKYKQLHKEIWWKIPIEGTDGTTKFDDSAPVVEDDAANALAGNFVNLQL